MHARSWLGLALCGAAACTAPAGSGWIPLFDGRSLGDWVRTEFGGEGDVTVEDGRIVLGPGSPLTGITWRGPELPVTDYELALEAERIDGSDFFCGLTFPVRDGHLTLVVGGWGGSLVGLSCLDGDDASDNETGRAVRLVNGHVYDIRVRVGSDRVEAWIDGDRVVDANIKGRALSLRPEVLLSRPLGVASFASRAALGRLRWRR